MSFDQIFTEASGAIYDQLGEQITYTPQSGPPISCQGVVDRQPLVQSGDAVEFLATAAQVCLRKADVPAQPRRGDTITAGATSMRVEKLVAATNWEWTLLCQLTA